MSAPVFGFMSLLKAALAGVAALAAGAVAAVKPLAKAKLQAMVRQEGEFLKRDLEEKGPEALDGLLRLWEQRILARIEAVGFLPQSVRDGAAALAKEEADKAIAEIEAEVKDKAPAEVDKAFAELEQRLCDRIGAL